MLRGRGGSLAKPALSFATTANITLRPASLGSKNASQLPHSEIDQNKPPLTPSASSGADGLAETGLSSGGGDAGTGGNSGDAGSIADASPEFRGEMGGLLAYYAARIAAARRSGASTLVQSIMNEQTAAISALMERWQAAAEKHRAERPKGAAGTPPKNVSGPKQA